MTGVLRGEAGRPCLLAASAPCPCGRDRVLPVASDRYWDARLARPPKPVRDPYPSAVLTHEQPAAWGRWRPETPDQYQAAVPDPSWLEASDPCPSAASNPYPHAAWAPSRSAAPGPSR